MLSELEFGAFLVYSPHGTSPYEQRCRDFVVRLKQDAALTSAGMRASEYVARRLRETLSGSLLEPMHTGSCSLVPVPRSGLLKPNSLWPGLETCKALVREGLGSDIHACLRRAKPVAKSAIAVPEERPSVETHYDSMSVVHSLTRPRRPLLVDDVITRGATLLAAASRLAEAYPDADVHAPAIVRVMPPGVTSMLSPCRGSIRRIGRSVRRIP